MGMDVPVTVELMKPSGCDRTVDAAGGIDSEKWVCVCSGSDSPLINLLSFIIMCADKFVKM